MNYMKIYNEWLENADDETVEELLALKDNKEEIEDRFYKTLEFGTAGLRGIMGAGTNRMNKYVLMQATKALADTVLEAGGADMKIVVISRDSSSGTFDAWKGIVMEKERVAPTALTQPSNGGLVTQIGNTKGAIGYIALGYINKYVKTLRVEGVQGSVETTLNGKYKISRPLYMFTNGWPKGETLNFINFILSQQGQKLVEEAGSIALY